jgi:hypothetical protein
MRHCRLLAAGLTAGLLISISFSGCGGDGGPPRYGLAGAISYEGQPVPFGWIVFAPENGPGATANIEDGKYTTPDDFGTVGGVHTIEVVAFDGVAVADPDAEGGMRTSGTLMFSYKFTKEIPKETTTWDIEISRADVESASGSP